MKGLIPFNELQESPMVRVFLCEYSQYWNKYPIVPEKGL